MLPAPEVPKPTLVGLDQLKVVPLVGLENGIAAPAAPLQITTLAMAATVGVGFIVTVKFCAGPGQPLAVGVTLTMAVMVEAGVLAVL